MNASDPVESDADPMENTTSSRSGSVRRRHVPRHRGRAWRASLLGAIAVTVGLSAVHVNGEAAAAPPDGPVPAAEVPVDESNIMNEPLSTQDPSNPTVENDDPPLTDASEASTTTTPAPASTEPLTTETAEDPDVSNSTTLPPAPDVTAPTPQATPNVVTDTASPAHPSMDQAGAEATAALSGVATVSGRVTGPNGEPIGDVEVYADGDDWGYATTDGDGRYEMSVAPGTYRIWFNPPGSSPYYDEYFDDAQWHEDPQLVTVVDGGQASGVDAQLSKAGTISGRVTGTSGEPIADVEVYADGESDYGYATTDGDGNYQLEVRAGSYRIDFDTGDTSPYFDEYFNNARWYEDAQLVTVTDGGQVAGIDAELSKAAAVSGRVTGPHDEPVAGIEVTAWDDEGSGSGDAMTDADGRYELKLRPGVYRVGFYPAKGSPYFEEYFNDVPWYGDADLITVADGGQVAGIDARLSQAATISGRVTGPNGEAVSGVEVWAYGDDDSADATTDGDGRYQLRVRPGSYRVRFNPAENSPYFSEYFDNARWYDDARLLTVVDGAEVASIDAELAKAVTISGRVTGPANEPVAGAEVWAEGDDDWADATTDGSGRYQLAVRPGTYTLWFNPPAGSPYFDEYYDNASWDEAERLTVDRTPLTGIDARLSVGGTVTGRVTGPGGTPIANVRVDIFEENLTPAAAHTTTDANGRYEVSVRPARYQVSFTPPAGSPYFGEWYDDTNENLAQSVTVSSNGIAHADAELTMTARITGRVTGPQGTPAPGTIVRAFLNHGYGESFETVANADGRYELIVRPGTYIVDFLPAYGSPYVAEYYDDASLFDAESVTVAAGGAAAGVDAELGVRSEFSVPSQARSLTAAVAPTTGVGSGQVRLTWDAPESDGRIAITDYVIQRSPNGTTGWTTVADGVSAARSYTVTGLTNGTRYYFRVAAKNLAGTGAYSGVVNTVPRATPSRVTSLKAVAKSGAVALSWAAPAGNGAAITDYVIQRSPNGTTRWTTVADGVSTARSYTVKRLTNGTRYYFRVAAKNLAGTGAYSSVVTTTPRERSR